jgi:hypothetical protein
MSRKILEIQPELKFIYVSCAELKANHPFQTQFKQSVDIFNKRFDLFKIKEVRATTFRYSINPDVAINEAIVTLAYIFVLLTRYENSHADAWGQGLPKIAKEISDTLFPVKLSENYIQEVVGKLIKIGLLSEYSFNDSFDYKLINNQSFFVRNEERLNKKISYYQSQFAYKFFFKSDFYSAKKYLSQLQEIHQGYSKALTDTEGNRQRLLNFIRETETVLDLDYAETKQLFDDCKNDIEKIRESMNDLTMLTLKISRLLGIVAISL